MLGKRGDTYDVEIGMVPTLEHQEVHRRAADLLGADLDHGRSEELLEQERRHDELLRSGVECALCTEQRRRVLHRPAWRSTRSTSVIPKRLGTWYVKGGFQYYHIINEALLGAQVLTGAAGGASGVAGTFPNAHKDICDRLRRLWLQLLIPRGEGVRPGPVV